MCSSMPRARRPHAMLDLRASDPGLAVWQRRYFDHDLPPELSAKQIEREAKRRLPAAVRAQGLAAWRHRALDEYRSQVGFTEFLAEVTELGCSYDILTAAVRLVRDEARHVELCRRMVAALGGDDLVPGTPHYVHSDKSLPLFERVLATTVASLCVGETFSVAFLVASRDHATHALSRVALEQLAKDESIHSQLGWRLLPMLWPLAPKAARRYLTRSLGPLLETSWEALFHGLDPKARPPPRGAFGDLLPRERQQVWDHALEHEVVNRFEALGLPARKAARAALEGKPRFD